MLWRRLLLPALPAEYNQNVRRLNTEETQKRKENQQTRNTEAGGGVAPDRGPGREAASRLVKAPERL